MGEPEGATMGPWGDGTPYPQIPNVYEAVGHTLANFNMLEMALRWLLVRLISPDQAAAQLVVFNDQRFEWLKQQLLDQANLRIGEVDLRTDWKAFLDDVSEIQRERNRIAHDPWMVLTKKDGSSQLRRTRFIVKGGSVQPVMTHLSSNHVHKVAADASALLVRFIALQGRLEQAGVLYPTAVAPGHRQVTKDAE